MSLDSAIRSWDAEVEAEAERLVKLGVPPWDAIIRARQRIEKQRRVVAQSKGSAVRPPETRHTKETP